MKVIEFIQGIDLGRFIFRLIVLVVLALLLVSQWPWLYALSKRFVSYAELVHQVECAGDGSQSICKWSVLNRGTASATNVRILLRSSGPMHGIDITSAEEYTLIRNVQRQDSVIVGLKRLAPLATVTIEQKVREQRLKHMRTLIQATSDQGASTDFQNPSIDDQVASTSHGVRDYVLTGLKLLSEPPSDAVKLTRGFGVRIDGEKAVLRRLLSKESLNALAAICVLTAAIGLVFPNVAALFFLGLVSWWPVAMIGSEMIQPVVIAWVGVVILAGIGMSVEAQKKEAERKSRLEKDSEDPNPNDQVSSALIKLQIQGPVIYQSHPRIRRKLRPV